MGENLNTNGISITWHQLPNTPPVTSTTVTFCGNSKTCTSPCSISGLDPGTEYQFTVIPNSKCGSHTAEYNIIENGLVLFSPLFSG